MLTYTQALQQVLETVQPLPARDLPLAEAAGLVLAAPAQARWDMPRWDNSAMDGYALAARAAGVTTSLTLVGSSYAGHPFSDKLQAGEAIQITTGATLPTGADSVVPVEETDVVGEEVQLKNPVQQGQHVRYRAEEYRAGEELLPAGTLLQSGSIGLLASAGVERVDVIPRPQVAIFSTGDELVELGQDPGPGQIINSNLQYLQARLPECDCVPLPLGIGEDRCEDLGRLLERAQDADLLLSTGGVSVGEKDLVQQTLLQHGFERKFWKVAIKPGKPVLFGTIFDKPCFGLPGNPAATAATFELLVRPALALLSGRGYQTGVRTARLQSELNPGGKRQAFLWCRCEWKDGGYQVEIPLRQGSGQARSIQGANALLPVAIGSPALSIGELVDVILIK